MRHRLGDARRVHLPRIARSVQRRVRVQDWLTFLRHVAKRELLLLVMPIVLVVGVFGFVAVTEEVLEGDVTRFDEMALLALRVEGNPSDPLGPRWLENSGRDITALGSGVVVVLFTVAVAGWLAIRKSWHEVVLLLGALGGGVALSFVLKGTFERERPSLVHQLDHVQTYSFPSGHALLSAVVYLTAGAVLARLFSQRRVKLYFLSVATLLTMMVGVSRVYVGVHYPSDVLAGWCAGAAWASFCWLVTIWLQWRGDVARDADTANAPGAHPAPAEAAA